jgi:thioredoxin-like negative regulator of GroEL
LALEVIAQVRQAHPEVALREVDLVAHPEVAVKYGVRSTPAIAIDGALAWEGIPSAPALRERIEASLRRREAT